MPRKPRYVAIASDLRRAIATGKIGVGDQLPTEVALCQAHGVSRHTARAALQLLEDARLIERKPGLGTRVISKDDRATFIQPLGGLSELLQYAREARLRITTIRPDALSSPEAKRFGASARSHWLRIEGVRRVGDRAVAAASIYVCASIGARAKDFENLRSAVTEAIERRKKILGELGLGRAERQPFPVRTFIEIVHGVAAP
jgi:DNA-binding GntR family transcriptional regulator